MNCFYDTCSPNTNIHQKMYLFKYEVKTFNFLYIELLKSSLKNQNEPNP